MKKCVTCKTEKELAAFGKNRSTKDGLHTECKACRKLYGEKNKEQIKEKTRIYRTTEAHKEVRKQYRQKDCVKQKEKGYERSIRSRRNARKKERKLHDINYKLGENLRKRLYMAVKFNFKAGSAVNDLGCTIEEFKIYIESKWFDGMSWQNWSQTGWHLDHMVPLTAFDLSDRKQFLKACHYTNLQPLWAEDNLSKGNRIKTNAK